MNETVMVVDDDSELREVVAAPCVILLDLAMPTMDGWQFREAQHADPRFSGIPVVLMTASRKLNGIAADGVMFKPLDSDQLLFTIRRHCQGRHH